LTFTAHGPVDVTTITVHEPAPAGISTTTMAATVPAITEAPSVEELVNQMARFLKSPEQYDEAIKHLGAKRADIIAGKSSTE